MRQNPQRSHRIALLAALPLSALAVACTSGGDAPEPAAAPPQFAPAAVEGNAAAPGAVAEAAPEEAAAEEPTTHTLATRVERADDGSLKLIAQVDALGAYHLNTDPAFPWRVSVDADAPIAAGTRLGSADAAQFDEQVARFEIAVADSAEAAEVAGDVVLGVCDDEGCIRVASPVTWEVAAR